MNNYQQLWQHCLQLIAGKVKQRVFDTWFKDITLESYSPDQHVVLLVVPHRYVYEYIEEVHAYMLKQALDTIFNTDVRISYRIREEPVEKPVIDFPAVGQIPRFSVANARERMEKGLRHFLGDRAQWLPCYDEVVQWLGDNKGRGLLCIGAPGLGKTLICCDILSVFLKERFGKEPRVTTLCESDREVSELLNERVVIVDNLGTEDEKIFGKKNRIFDKLCDTAERRGILLIITTNLSTNRIRNPLYTSSIQERYGPATLERLRAVTTVVEFKGEKSMRR